MRATLTRSLLAAALVLVCVVTASFAAAAQSSPVLDAPARTPEQAAADARAALAEVTLPAGSVRLAAPPPALRAPLEPDFTMGYVTFRTATAYWRLASAHAAAALLAQAPAGATTWSDTPGTRGARIELAAAGAWIGPRWLVLATLPDPSLHGAWLAELQSVAVFTPWRLEVPTDVASVTVTRLRDGAVLARVSAPAAVAAVVAAVNGLPVDDAVDAFYGCPALLDASKPGFEIRFAAASGALLASASTQWCPQDLSLEVGSHAPQRLILGDLVARLQGILGIALPPTVG
jgi:hypothetical protein